MTNNRSSKPHPFASGAVFLWMLAMVFAINVAVRAPIQPAINVASCQIADLQQYSSEGKWFVLEPETVAPLSRAGKTSDSGSFVLLFRRHFTYYVAIVETNTKDGPKNNWYTILVRTTADKAQRIENGEQVSFYGMISTSPVFDEETSTDLSVLVDAPLCLNDNGDTVGLRWIATIVFAILTAMSVSLGWIIYNVPEVPRTTGPKVPKEEEKP